MSLEAGARLGPYEILSSLGAGGMGEVYKARDTRLDRLVAIKILSEGTAGSADARERFEREARAISRLSDSRICALFDVGLTDDVAYLVMELLDGQTLAARLSQGALPMEQVLRIGRDIAGALAAAHRHGIVHRDLKPGNVMLTSAGVKLLDFGLAKTIEPMTMDTDTAKPTVAALTAPGTWLGTAPYMAPEQIDGRPTDARVDVFALGAVLYEMAVGRRAFDGNTTSAIAAAILHHEPPAVSSRLPDAPSAFDRLVHDCLEKDVERRWQSAHDVALQLQTIEDATRHPSLTSSARQKRTSWLLWAGTVATVAVATAAITLWANRVGSASTGLTLQVLPPANGTFSSWVETVGFAVSPDGNELAFVASQSGVPRRVWRRPLASIEATPIAGTDGATSAFWSPDGKSIAFFTGDTLKRIDLASGVAVPICKVPTGVGLFGTWGLDGYILFASIDGDGIYRVPTSGGTPTRVVKPDSARDEVNVRFPSFLPDGRFLYLSRLRAGTFALMLGAIDKPPQRITAVDSNVQYVDSGALVFARGGTLVGQPFDLSTGQVTGEPFAIAPSVRFFLTTGTAAFAAAPSGTLVYQSQSDSQRLAWLDRAGRELETVGHAGRYLDLRLTPTGRAAIFSRTLPSTGTFDVWSLDLDRNTETRVTLDDGFTEFAPVMPIGDQSLIFAAASGERPQLIRRNLATNQDERLIPTSSRFQEPEDVSPDGQTLAYSERTDRGPFNLWTVGLGAQAKPSALRTSPFNEEGLRFSPDGRFYTFGSSESGRPEVYVSALAGGVKIPVSNGGGRARWSRDGRELFYLSQDRRLMAVPVSTAPTLHLGTPVTLFAVGTRPWVDYDASPDGKRFLAIIPEVVADEQPLTAILNFRAPTSK